MTQTAQEMAELHADKAREYYAEDGRIDPLMVLQNEECQVILVMQGSDDMPRSFGACANLLAVVVQPTTVVTVVEAWAKKYEIDERPDTLPRGELQRMHDAGDEAVQTVLLTHAWQLPPAPSVFITDEVTDETGVFVRREDTHVEGRMLDMILAGWTDGLQAPPPPETEDPHAPLKVCLQVLAERGLIRMASVAVYGPEEGGN